jgi:predicted esterase
MPWRLPNYGYNNPKDLGIFNDTSKQYILAGHSKGAAMASQFLYENPTLVDKLILMGSTHPKRINLSHSYPPCELHI